VLLTLSVLRRRPSVTGARNRLVRLRKKGYIEIDPEGPGRGPSVEYVATAKIDDLDP
jgi:hypothetical protein